MDNISQAMINAAYEALMVLDEQLNVITLNRSASEFFGERAVPGVYLGELMPSSELEATLQYIIENEEEEFEIQTTIDSRFLRVRTRLFHAENDQLMIGLALQDVTELVRLNRARRDMVQNISHELRTPIANIRLIIDSLFHEADRPKRKKSIQSIRAIARETDALQWLVHELLDLSMIESGQAIVRMVDVPIAEMIDEALERMAEQAASREIALIAKVSDDVYALCDRDLVRRVLINLLHNALKFSPRGSSITVAAQDTGETVTFTVSDKGPGVPADQVDRVFERFYQVDGSRSKGEGTGLGLAICKHIIEAHGGKIWARPTEQAGGGSFSFTLLNAKYDTEGDIDANLV